MITYTINGVQQPAWLALVFVTGWLCLFMALGGAIAQRRLHGPREVPLLMQVLIAVLRLIWRRNADAAVCLCIAVTRYLTSKDARDLGQFFHAAATHLDDEQDKGA